MFQSNTSESLAPSNEPVAAIVRGGNTSQHGGEQEDRGQCMFFCVSVSTTLWLMSCGQGFNRCSFRQMMRSKKYLVFDHCWANDPSYPLIAQLGGPRKVKKTNIFGYIQMANDPLAIAVAVQAAFQVELYLGQYGNVAIWKYGGNSSLCHHSHWNGNCYWISVDRAMNCWI